MDCYFCGTETDAAVDAGWIPSFWHGDREVDGQVCPSCCKAHLRFNEEMGDYEVPETVHAR